MTDRLGRLLLITLDAARVHADVPTSRCFAPGSTHCAALVPSNTRWPTRVSICSPRAYDERGRRATFCTTRMEHSPPSARGTGAKPTPSERYRCGTRRTEKPRRTADDHTATLVALLLLDGSGRLRLYRIVG
jgi:hypothetical protein